MRILQKSVYLGPNLYALFPVIRLTVDLGELEQWPSVKLGPAFTDALLDKSRALGRTVVCYSTKSVDLR